MSKMLEGKIVLITGSSRGIGAAVAKLAKGYGADVVLHGQAESEHLKQLSKELNSYYIFCDVSNPEVVKNEVEKVLKEKGRIDVLINCAGIVGGRDFLDLTENNWEEVFRVNVFGTAYFCQSVARDMLKRKYGRIINFSSIRGLSLARVGIIPYDASKAAIINFTQALAKRLAPNIAVNAVAPGTTDSESVLKSDPELLENFIETSLIKKLVPVKDVAETVLFLASDKAASLTGQTIVVDGGALLAN